MKESETTELKRSLSELKEGLISVAAILNKHGAGELWFGVKNNGIAVGKGNISRRRNPLIADLFRRIQMVKAWGRGMPLILKNEPHVKFREIANIFIAGFDRPSFTDEGSEIDDKTLQATGAQSGIESGLSRDQVGTKLGLSPEEVIQILSFCSITKAIQDIQTELKRSNRTKFRNKFINPLLREGLLEMTIPNKPNSRLQKYRLTEKGERFLKDKGEVRQQGEV